jgi:hypothetical protein
MSTFYMDFVNGDDSKDGSSWANAWKTMKDGATAARITAGDTIKIAKTPDPASLGVNVTFAQRNRTATLASALTANIDLCENAWTSDGGADVVCSTQFALNQGSYSAQMQVKAAFGTGLAAHREITEIDLSSYQNVSFYIYASVAVAASSLRLDLCSDTAGATAVDSVTVPFAIVAGKKYPYTYKKGSALGASIKSVALTVLIDLGGSDVNVRLDNILACNSLCLDSMIGKSGGPYYPVRAIDGTSVYMGGNGASNTDKPALWLWTETVTAYTLEMVRIGVAMGGTQEGFVNEGGTDFENLIVFAGGYNTSTGSQDGKTWIAPRCFDVDGSNNASLIDLNGMDFIEVQKLGFAQAGYGLYTTNSVPGLVINGCDFSANYYNPLFVNTYNQGHGMVLKGAINVYCCGALNFPPNTYTTYAGGTVMQHPDSVLSVYHPGNVTMSNFAGGSYLFLGKLYFEETSYHGYSINFSSIGEDSYFNEIEMKNVYNGFNGSPFGSLNIEKVTVTGGNALFNNPAGQVLGKVRIGRYTQVSGTPTEWATAPSGSTYQGCQDFLYIDHYKADNRWKAIGRFGTISDHITGGQAAAWAYGGTGLSMLISPNNQTLPLVHSFRAPVKSGTALKLRMQVCKTASAAGCRLFVSIAGAGCTPVYREEVTLTDSWAEYASTSFTPTRNGFITVTLHVYDGATSGDVGIDAITVAAAA